MKKDKDNKTCIITDKCILKNYKVTLIWFVITTLNHNQLLQNNQIKLIKFISNINFNRVNLIQTQNVIKIFNKIILINKINILKFI